jgi:hypothetical protein
MRAELAGRLHDSTDGKYLTLSKLLYFRMLWTDNFVLNDHEIGISPGALETHFETSSRAAGLYPSRR